MFVLQAAALAFVCLIWTAKCNVSDDSNRFAGEDLWIKEALWFCDNPPNNETVYSDPALKCYQYRADLRLYRLEVLNYAPLLVVFRNFIDREEIEGFLLESSALEVSAAEVVERGLTYVQNPSRVANISYADFEPAFDHPAMSRVLDRARRAIPSVDFDVSEHWQIMSYGKGGHYVPHNDLLDYPETDEDLDYWMEEYGNRLYTFLLVFRTADVGGGTIFPNLNLTVMPNAGDLMFWQSMDSKKNEDQASLHGACPLRSGFKTAATIWIREMNQKVFDGLFKTGRFDDDLVVQPKANHISRAI